MANENGFTEKPFSYVDQPCFPLDIYGGRSQCNVSIALHISNSGYTTGQHGQTALNSAHASRYA